MTKQLLSGVTTYSGTISEFICARESLRPDNQEHREAFYAEVEAMLVQLVYDSEDSFCGMSQLMLPKLNQVNVNRWLDKLAFWYSHILTGEEREIVLTTTFIWS